MSEKTGLSKLFIRSIKRGNEEIKQLTAKINENVSATDKRIKASRAPDKSAKVANSPKSAKQEPESVAGVKRARPAESTAAGQPAKRLASGSAAPPSKESAAAKLGLVKKAGATPAAASAAPKTNVVKAPTKATTSFFGLQSASKKPGTSNADQANKKPAPGTTADKDKKPAPKAATPASRPAFSFAETNIEAMYS